MKFFKKLVTFQNVIRLYLCNQFITNQKFKTMQPELIDFIGYAGELVRKHDAKNIGIDVNFFSVLIYRTDVKENLFSFSYIPDSKMFSCYDHKTEQAYEKLSPIQGIITAIIHASHT